MDYTPNELKFEVRQTRYLKEELFKVSMPQMMNLRYGHDLVGFLQPAFPGIVEIQNQVERPETVEGAGKTVEVFGRRLVQVDFPTTKATTKVEAPVVPAVETEESEPNALADLLNGGLKTAPVPEDHKIKGKKGHK
jgi:hypothetical protein